MSILIDQKRHFRNLPNLGHLITSYTNTTTQRHITDTGSPPSLQHEPRRDYLITILVSLTIPTHHITFTHTNRHPAFGKAFCSFPRRRLIMKTGFPDLFLLSFWVLGQSVRRARKASNDLLLPLRHCVHPTRTPAPKKTPIDLMEGDHNCSRDADHRRLASSGEHSTEKSWRFSPVSGFFGS